MELSSTKTSASVMIPKPAMSKRRILKNLFVICCGYFLMFCAYQALANLQSTINVEGNVGLISQSVIYAALIFSSLYLPKLVIRKIGCKKTLLLGALTYAPYIAANFYPSMATFVPTSILLGLGAAPLWSAKCTYINEISALYASQGSESAEVVTSRFFGIFFMIFQNTQIWGNVVSFFVLRPAPSDGYISNLTSSDQENGTADASSGVVCGAGFCTGLNENLMPPSDEKRYVLIGIYLGLVLSASAVLGLFLDSLQTKKEDDHESILSHAAATLRHLKKVDQMLLIPITVFSGIEQAFILGDFSKAYVACAWGLYHVGLVFICFGIVDAAMSYLAGRLVKCVSRLTLMYAAAAGNIAVCVVLLLWEPNSRQYIVFFILVGIWGFSDAIWQTQLNSLYGVLFRSEAEAAFSNYRLWESLGFSIAFGYSTFLCVTPKIFILVAFAFAGILGYTVVEIRSQMSKSQEREEGPATQAKEK